MNGSRIERNQKKGKKARINRRFVAVLSVILCVALTLGLMTSAFAEGETTIEDPALAAAEQEVQAIQETAPEQSGSAEQPGTTTTEEPDTTETTETAEEGAKTPETVQEPSPSPAETDIATAAQAEAVIEVSEAVLAASSIMGENTENIIEDPPESPVLGVQMSALRFQDESQTGYKTGEDTPNTLNLLAAYNVTDAAAAAGTTITLQIKNNGATYFVLPQAPAAAQDIVTTLPIGAANLEVFTQPSVENAAVNDIIIRFTLLEGAESGNVLLSIPFDAQHTPAADTKLATFDATATIGELASGLTMDINFEEEEILPLASNPDDITVSAAVASTFKTYTDRTSDSPPGQLPITLTITLKEKNIKEGEIVLPYAFTPTPGAGEYTDFAASMTEPFFSFDETKNSLPSFADKFVQDANGLTIKLKENLPASQYTITLYFDFDMNYDGKIPGGTTLYSSAPEAYADGGVGISTGNTFTVKAAATQSPGDPTISYFSPLASKNDTKLALYENGQMITTRIRYNLNAYYQNNFDENTTLTLYVDIPDDATPETSITNYFTQSANLNNGYMRYYREITPPITSATNSGTSGGIFSLVYQGNEDSNFRQMDISYRTATGKTVGAEFDMTIGMIYTKYNTQEKELTATKKYKLVNEFGWDINLNSMHNTGNNWLARCNTADGSKATNPLYASYISFGHGSTTKNSGSTNIENVEMKLYQASAGSEKVNFDNITIRSSRDTDHPWSHYKITLTIANGGSTRKETAAWQPAGAGGTASYTIRFDDKSSNLKIVLNSGEYISEVSVVPMGTDGNETTSKGVWPRSNGIGITYLAKAWDGQTWPDGTSVDTSQRSIAVPMSWTLTYKNNPNADKDAGAQLTWQGATANVYYITESATEAYAKLVSTNSIDRAPGDIVDYEIQGYNDYVYAATEWTNPYIAVRVPKVLALVDSSVGAVSANVGDASGASVTPISLGSDTDYNYYAFQVSGYSVPIEQNNNNNKQGTRGVAFTIPVQFKIADGTAPGTYKLDRTVVSQESKGTFYQIGYRMNNLPIGENATNYGIGAGQNYTVTAASRTSDTIFASTPVVVGSRGILEASTYTFGKGTGNTWDSSDFAHAENGETVKLKLEIANTGNTTYGKVKLYNILPASGDTYGSSGTFTFAGVDITGATVYYTEAPVNTLPAYGTDLQKMDLSANGWTTSTIANPTAIFIDFGTAQVAPGETLEGILSFQIPATGEQTVFNKFCYSAVEAVTNTQADLYSPLSGFSTEAINIEFLPNMPSITVPSETAPQDMPSTVTGTFGLGGNKLTIPNNTPTLTGYVFDGWYIDGDFTSTKYAADGTATYTFTAAGKVTMHAKWLPMSTKITVTFDKNGGDTDASPISTDFTFGTSVTAADLPTTNPTRAGYIFGGWSTSSGDNNGPANFGANTPINFTADKTVYAVWSQDTTQRALTFDPNGGTIASGTTPQMLAFGDFASEVTATRQGYQFDGWYKDVNDPSTRWDFTTTMMGDTAQTLLAKWTPDTYTITFDSDGANIDANPASMQFTVPDNTVTALPAEPQKTGYLFGGWFTQKNGVGNPFDIGTVVTADGTVYAKWDSYTYTVTFDVNGGDLPAPANIAVSSPDTTVGNTNMPKDPTRSGYKFAGWFTEQAGGTLFTGTTPVTKDITVYARWVEEPSFFVLYDGNGADVQADPQLMIITAPQTHLTALPAPPQRAGYTFSGWNTAADGTGQMFDINTAITQDYVVYAQWVANYYQLSFDLNGAPGETPQTQSLKAGEYAAPVANPAREGYNFLGWNTERNGSGGTWAFDVHTMPATHMALFANWQQIVSGGGGGTGGGGATTTTTTTPPTTTTTTTTTAPDEGDTGTTGTTENTAGGNIAPEPQNTDDATDADDDANPVTIGDEGAPLEGFEEDGSGDVKTWAYVNLILCIAGGIFMIVLLIVGATRDRKGKYGDSRQWVAWVIASIVLGLISILVFILTQDMSAMMVPTDQWTLLSVILLVAEAVCSVYIFKKAKEEGKDRAKS